jgi:rhodanese-related sulfurtransferase
MSFFLVNCDEKQELNSITTFKLKELLVKENIQLLDVRSPEEIKQGAIKTALFVNYFDDDFAKKATNKLDKNKPVYLYCRSGNRSGKSAIILKEKGFEVYNIIGGYNQWKKEN